MGQTDVHVPHCEQFGCSGTSRSAGHATVLRSARPMIMNGAIQQTVWQPPRRPTASANVKNSPTTAK
jgi:hypothetical protein